MKKNGIAVIIAQRVKDKASKKDEPQEMIEASTEQDMMEEGKFFIEAFEAAESTEDKLIALMDLHAFMHHYSDMKIEE